jgi:hypothetical protein
VRKSAFSLLCAFAGLALAPVQSAQAGLRRVWVSGNGVDGPTCGAVQSPCREISYALSQNIVSPGGEIDIKDSSGFQPFTITYSVSIINDGVGTTSIVAGAATQSAITVQAGGSDSIYLRGLSLDGGGLNGTVGINVTSAGSIAILNCTARHFWVGIKVTPQNALSAIISDAFVGENSYVGILVDGQFAKAGSKVVATIKNSTADHNLQGYWIFSYPKSALVTALIVNSIASNNSTGLNIEGSTAAIAQSSIFNNAKLGYNIAGGILNTYANNSIVDTNNSGALTPVLLR